MHAVCHVPQFLANAQILIRLPERVMHKMKGVKAVYGHGGGAGTAQACRMMSRVWGQLP